MSESEGAKRARTVCVVAFEWSKAGIFSTLYWLRSYRRMQVGALIGSSSCHCFGFLALHTLNVRDHLDFSCHET
jgi:hypothetical protein